MHVVKDEDKVLSNLSMEMIYLVYALGMYISGNDKTKRCMTGIRIYTMIVVNTFL